MIKLGRRLSAQHQTVIAEIVRLLTPGYPVLEAEVRAAVHRDVTRFVEGQIQALPDFLRLPYKVAIAVFDWLPLMRWLRTFRGLDDGRKDRYLSEWTEARVAAMRNFVKLIRGCALLAYFDHPVVRAALESQRGGGAEDVTRPAMNVSRTG